VCVCVCVGVCVCVCVCCLAWLGLAWLGLACEYHLSSSADPQPAVVARAVDVHDFGDKKGERNAGAVAVSGDQEATE
jgi:hypothetical protein